MNLVLPTGRPGKLLATFILLLAILAVWRLAVAPLVDSFLANAESLEDAKLRLARMERQAAQMHQAAQHIEIDALDAHAITRRHNGVRQFVKQDRAKKDRDEKRGQHQPATIEATQFAPKNGASSAPDTAASAPFTSWK